MDKVIGNLVGVPNPKSDWNQTDETKADYIKNKPTKLSQFEDDLTKPIIINFDENLKGDISYMKLSIVFAQGRDIVGKTVIDGDESCFIYFDTITMNINEIILTASDLGLTRKWICYRSGGWEYKEIPLTNRFDDAMSDTSENAVRNKVVKAYVDKKVSDGVKNKANKSDVYTKTEVDEKCNDTTKTITEQLEITTSIRDSIPHTEFVCIVDARSDALREVVVTVNTDYMADAENCYLEVYTGGTIMAPQLYRTIYNSVFDGCTAIFKFEYYGEFSVRARWKNETINDKCLMKVTYVRDISEVIGNIETALDDIIALQESFIGGAE